MSRRDDPIEIQNVVALRTAGKALVVAVFDPKQPDRTPARENEVMIPISQIDKTSKVKKPDDRGTLIIPHWLAVDRDLADEDDD